MHPPSTAAAQTKSRDPAPSPQPPVPHLYTDLTQPPFNGWIMCYLQAADGANAPVTLKANATGLKGAQKELQVKDFVPPGM
ncbi:MAG TPA: hypothetical protein VH253_15510 [Phycisphaerae bacterium]|nr:hypothetical protein [Phycisphaerae bacterium]